MLKAKKLGHVVGLTSLVVLLHFASIYVMLMTAAQAENACDEMVLESGYGDRFLDWGTRSHRMVYLDAGLTCEFSAPSGTLILRKDLAFERNLVFLVTAVGAWLAYGAYRARHPRSVGSVGAR